MPTSYDDVRYPSTVTPQTLPSRLAVLAHLRGRSFVPFSSARVLEIGCGTGTNILNLASMAPGAQFVGFDLAETAIAEGRALAEAAGLTNVELKAGDILDVNVVSGAFDYIICHGVLAWVPEAVRDGLYGLIGRHLSADGLAFVSYNVLPGCNVRLTIRQALQDRIAAIEPPAERIVAAREALEFYAAAWQSAGALGQALSDEARSILTHVPEAMFHDELGEIYAPQLLGEVVEAARREGLDYLCDAQPHLSREAFFPSSDGQAVRSRAGDDWVRYEQIDDMVTQRRFRESVFCRAGAPVEHLPDWQRLRLLYAHGRYTPVPPAVPEMRSFTIESGQQINIRYDGLAALLFEVNAAYPDSIALGSLADDERLGNAIWELYARGMLTLLTEPFRYVAAPGERPVASPLARAQAARGDSLLATQRHGGFTVKGEPLSRLVALLDGTRTIEQLAESFGADTSIGIEDARVQVATVLRELAQRAVLIG